VKVSQKASLNLRPTTATYGETDRASKDFLNLTVGNILPLVLRHVFKLVDQPIFFRKLELSTRGTDEFSFDSDGFFHFCRQTGGLRFVVSHAAIFDRNLHLSPLVMNRSLVQISCR
jgi:hypothetical protein